MRFFTTALWMLGLGLMTKRPFWSGMVLGLLVYKPHFAVIAPLIFLLRRDKQGLAGLTVSAGSFLLISTLVFGTAIWPLFISTSTTASHMLSTGIILPWEKIGSLFVSMRLLGVPVIGAAAIHILGAGVTLFLLARLWLTKAPADVKYAATLISTLLVTPHQFDYDLVLLLGAIAFWVRGAGSTLSDREKILLVLLWFAPLFTPPLAKITHLGFLPVILLAALVALSHRAEKQSMLPPEQTTGNTPVKIGASL
jgi:alpha-1,2-mannosyltransferase